MCICFIKSAVLDNFFDIWPFDSDLRQSLIIFRMYLCLLISWTYPTQQSLSIKLPIYPGEWMPIKHKYPFPRETIMLEQIEQAVDNFASMNPGKQAKVKEILGRYVQGEVGLEEVYYELLDNDLISMPQRCGMHAKIHTTAEDEKKLKNYIDEKMFR